MAGRIRYHQTVEQPTVDNVRTIIMVLAAGLVIGAPVADAQDSPGVARGTRVRLWLHAGRFVAEHVESGRSEVRVGGPPRAIHGILGRVSRDTVTVVAPAWRYRVPRTTVARMETSTGRRGHVGTGAIVVGVAGAVAGLVTVSALCGDSGCIGSGVVLFPLGIIGGAVLGGSLGAGVGFLVRSERWRATPLPGAAGDARTTRIGVSLRVSIGRH